MTQKIKLFCLPYAGGSAFIYSKWKLRLAKNIELCPIELAGRGSRITEKFYVNLDAAVNDIYEQIVDDISEFDYAIFGHSMGALLAYELIQKIKSVGLKPPVHAFFSGRKPPGTPRKGKPFSLMSPSEFEEKILDLGGTPPEFFEYPELKKVFIPLLRSDFTLSESKINRPEISPLATNITIFLGETEGVPMDMAIKWKKHTEKECFIYYLEGGHFFLFDQEKEIIEIINTSLFRKNLRALV